VQAFDQILKIRHSARAFRTNFRCAGFAWMHEAEKWF